MFIFTGFLFYRKIQLNLSLINYSVFEVYILKLAFAKYKQTTVRPL